jgi:MIP family channel proteins
MYGTSTTGGLQQEEKAEYGTSAMQEGMTPVESGISAKTPMDVELRDSRFHQSLLAEWFGTTAFVFFLVLSIMTANADPVRIALVAGLTFFGIVYMLASISGAHFNPAVTLGMWAARRITTLRAISYILFQLIGGLTGAALARSVSIKMFRSVHGGANAVAPGISSGSAFWIELLGTLFLVMAVLAASDTDRNARWPHRSALVPLEVALTIFLLHVVLIPFTGCSINPARSFGTAVVGHYWRLHWIWWVAPLVGGLVAALLYSIMFFFNESPKEELTREGVLERGGLGGIFGKGRGEQQAGTTGRTVVTTSG